METRCPWHAAASSRQVNNISLLTHKLLILLLSGVTKVSWKKSVGDLWCYRNIHIALQETFVANNAALSCRTLLLLRRLYSSVYSALLWKAHACVQHTMGRTFTWIVGATDTYSRLTGLVENNCEWGCCCCAVDIQLLALFHRYREIRGDPLLSW